MRKIILTILICVICCPILFAHSIAMRTSRVGNVYYTTPIAGETQYQVQAIAYLCNQYIQEYFPKVKENVYLEIDFEYEKDTRLAYDLYQGNQWNNAEKRRPVKGKGIRIQFSQSQNRAENILKLLEYGLMNLNSLKRKNSVDSSVIQNISQSQTSKNVKSILDIKVFRELRKSREEYFFQNDKYFFTDFFKNDSVYLVLNQVYQIISEHYIGSLIFETDSTGYFYNRKNRTLSEQFTISNKLSSFYYIHTSSDDYKRRIYFEYKPYGGFFGEKKKFIYLANDFFLIQDVEKHEDAWIEQLMNKK